MAVGDSTAYPGGGNKTAIFTDPSTHRKTSSFGVEDFESPNAAGDTAIQGLMWDIGQFKEISITAHENNNQQNQTIKLYVSNQQLPPSTTHATMVKQCDEITGGVALTKDTTIDVMWVENNAISQRALDGARWLVIEVVGAAANGKVDLDILAKN